MAQSSLIPIVVVVLASVIAAITDVWKFKVYNILTMPLLVTGLIYHSVHGGVAGLTASLLGVLFGFGILVAFYVMGGVGAGDVKLMAAVGAWLGMPYTYYVFTASALAAGIYAVGLMLYYGTVSETLMNLMILWHRVTALSKHLRPDDRIESEVTRADRRRRLIPFGAMMAVGIFATLAWNWSNHGRMDIQPYAARPEPIAPTGYTPAASAPREKVGQFARSVGETSATLESPEPRRLPSNGGDL